MNTPLLCLAMLALSAGSAHAQSATEYRLYDEGPRPAEESPPEQVTYRPTNLDDRGFNRVLEDISVPTLTVYHPAQPRPDRAAFVLCPGGGYRYVVMDREGHMLARHFQARGFTVAVLKYRLPEPPLVAGDLPHPQMDGLEAVRYLRRFAPSWGLNPQRIGIMGASAGGHLAASIGVLGQADDLSRPDFVALLYPVITFEPPYAHEGSRTRLLGENASADQVSFWSLPARVAAGTPPYFFVHARDDTSVPYQNSELMASALAAVGTPAHVLLVDRGGHGFALGRGPDAGRWPDAFITWLDGLGTAP